LSLVLQILFLLYAHVIVKTIKPPVQFHCANNIKYEGKLTNCKSV